MSVDIKDFGDTDKKLLSKLSKRGAFDPCLERHVDMARVNVDVMGRWVGERLTELLGFEDEVVIGLVKNLLSVRADALTGQAKRVDPKALQVQLTGFLEKQAAPFVAELWQLLLKAQDAPYGIPPAFVEKKKEQLRAQKSDQREATQRRIVAEASRHGRRAEEPVAASVDEGSGERARERSNKRTRFSSPTKRRREDDDDRSTMDRRRRGLWERRESRSQPGQWYYYNTRTKQTRWNAPEDDEKISVSHILIKHVDSKRPSSWRASNIGISKADAREELSALRRRILASSDQRGEFVRLAGERSDCQSASKGGELKPFSRGDFDKAFETAAFDLSPQSLSPIVDTPSGLHLIYRHR